MGGGASSEQQGYQAYQAQQQPADPAPRNHLPRLYSKSDMMKEVWKFLHKPRYVDLDQLDRNGRTASQVARYHGMTDPDAVEMTPVVYTIEAWPPRSGRVGHRAPMRLPESPIARSSCSVSET